MAAIVDIAINPDTGPEVLTGSSRLKAGTAQKMVLNMISTAGMVRLGKVFGNLMVDVAATNAKLEARQARIVMQACNCDHKEAEELLAASGRHCKTAILMPLGKLDAQGARSLLANHKGRLLPAIMAAGQKKATRHDGEGQLQIVLGPGKAQRAAESLAAMAGARIEQRLRRVIPDNLDVFLTPLITLQLAGTLTHLAIKPLGVVLFDGMS